MWQFLAAHLCHSNSLFQRMWKSLGVFSGAWFGRGLPPSTSIKEKIHGETSGFGKSFFCYQMVSHWQLSELLLVPRLRWPTGCARCLPPYSPEVLQDCLTTAQTGGGLGGVLRGRQGKGKEKARETSHPGAWGQGAAGPTSPMDRGQTSGSG